MNLLYPLLSSDVSKSVSDEELVDLYLETQNTAYFNLLYKRYSGKIFGKCISLLKSESLAEDATQDVMMKILMNLSKYSGKSRFSTWIYSITYNYCIDFLRRKKKDPSVYVDDFIENLDVEDEVEDHLLLETNVNRLKVILEDIPTGDKTILLMKYQDEMSIKEIGSVLDKSESAIKMKIKRAKQKFRDTYKDKYND
ncbi:MAG: sigma-70 family RNA polymerase sigma factor [Saprospiraceae bacterium]|nr:sigma-70 family RNA polymerase sigma factor [Bacteroidia bacterium]MBT8230643.1 sigma-70 family RNA polymerase sigma factor [Bacteroidia bacterium]NNF22234.1 sigma-70 family RNA polymerase sigma factor [Saprospiraceae bacterium]